MKLDDILGYATIKTKIRVQNFDTKQIIYDDYVIGWKEHPNLLLSYFKVENDYILFMVYEKE